MQRPASGAGASAVSLPSLAAALRGGSLSLEELLAQLEDLVARREPELLALVPEERRFERLRREALTLRRRFPDRSKRPALYGVPVGVKDIFCVEGHPTRAGSRLPEIEFEGQEAEAVTRLTSEGALVLGKTVSTEFAYFAPGPTRNPHDRERTPGGSSSGSAAAVAAGFCPLALGTQTIGSISRPASFCGVVGFKPSYDRVSRRGVIPLAPALDHVGIFTAGVAGSRVVAPVLCDDWSGESVDEAPVLGIPVGRYLERAAGEAHTLFIGLCDRLSAAGYRLERVDAMPEFAAVEARHELILAAEAAATHAAWFDRYRDLYHPKTAELVERGRLVQSAELERARAGRETLRRELTALMDATGVDLWISPAACGVAPRGLESTGDPVMNLPWTHAGLPTLAVPAAVNREGLPLGLQIAGRFWQDERLLAWGMEVEQTLARDE